MAPSSYKIKASETAAPESEEQVSQLLRQAQSCQHVVVPQGGGTKDALGGCLDKADLLLSLKNLSGILQHSIGDLMVTALPGTTVDELQEALGREGQFLPIDPGWGKQSTIGGMVAANAFGPKRPMYGSARDHLIAARVVLADGTPIRTGAKVVKNVAGYDMNKLLVGSMGTLGVLTELTFKIRPLPASSSLLAFPAKDRNTLRAMQGALLDSQLEPCAVELISPVLGQELFAAPEPMLVALFEDVEPSVRYQADWIRTFGAGLGLKPILECCGRSVTEPVVERLRGVVPSSNDVPEDKLVVSVKLLSSMTEVAGIFEYIVASEERSGLQAAFSGGLYSGISFATIRTVWERLQDVIGWINDIYAYMSRLNGAAVLAFAPKQVRSSVPVWGIHRSEWSLMKGMKQKLDPANTLNRGRFVGGI